MKTERLSDGIQTIIGKVYRVIGPVVEVTDVRDAQMLELVEAGESHLVGEIVRLHGDKATVQVYEDTTGLTPGEAVYGSGMPLSCELGPGIIGTIFDGIQRPLEEIQRRSGLFISKGVHVPNLDRTKKWHFVPLKNLGDEVSGGEIIGTVQETTLIELRVLVPPKMKGKITYIAQEDEYVLDDIIARLDTIKGEENIQLYQRWPVRTGRPYAAKLPLSTPLITGQRVIDMLFPLPKGGCVAVPGGFGTGKTMIQHALAKWCDADIILFIGCGERGNEITDMLTEFPKLIDPRTGKAMMERSIIIANTSNMPVAAREASIYTGITMAEYYRDMGYHVAVMADSTSRWAEALRELSGRMEEMPADEGYPAYLPTRLAEFYERAGMVDTHSGHRGSVTVIGSVSPPGGDFSEPVTQHTRRFVRCFWALDRQLANARHYPAISWLDSYSEYIEDVCPWWESNVSADWMKMRTEIMELLQRENRLQQVVKLVGPDVLPDSQRLILEVATMFKNAFLQQSAFDKIDMFSVAKKQVKMLKIILTYYERGAEMIKKGATLVKLKRMKVHSEIAKMKFAVPNDEIGKLDEILGRVNRAMDEMGAFYDTPAEL
jgi:V/A-type H+/Na+-transporting ATPase subunit A